MKYLKYLLILILLLVAIFFIRGFMTPSISYNSEITVNKSAKESWAVMGDETKLSQWITGYIRTELVSGVASTPGAVSNVYVDQNGTEAVMQETINEVIPEKLLAMTFSIGDMGMDMDYKITLEESDNKTKIKSSTTTTGKGIFSKSIVSFMKGMMKDQEDLNLNNLKSTIESNTTDYFPAPVLEAEVLVPAEQ